MATDQAYAYAAPPTAARTSARGLLPKKKGKGLDVIAGDLYSDISGRANDPTRVAQDFLPFFQQGAADTARGVAAPAQRDFARTLQTQAASVASRWGGNASSEESRIIGTAGDDFSRNLTEALARLSSSAVSGAAQAGSQSYADQDRLRSLLLEAMSQKKQKPGMLERLIGAGLGFAGAALTPHSGGAGGAAAVQGFYGGGS